MAKKTAAKTAAKRSASRKTAAKRRRAGTTTVTGVLAPIVAPGSPQQFRVRVRMYRHGLGDCFLLTFPRKDRKPFHMLVDCGALERDKPFMAAIVQHIRDTVLAGGNGKARLDVVVATHEHKDHLSGFNQARPLFSNGFDFGAVWLGWTENLTKPEIRKIKEARKKAVAKLHEALASPLAAANSESFEGIGALLAFSDVDDPTHSKTIANALEYVKHRGKDAGNLQYLEPGQGPIELDGVDGVRVYVLGPPRDPILLKGSEVTERMKKEGVIYHLSRTGEAGIEALSLALSAAARADGERGHPFSAEHRIPRESPDPRESRHRKPNPYFAEIEDFVARTYDDRAQQWRRIDRDWLSAFGQLALDLDNDTNNTSLVLAFEFVKTREVLLFVGDAQVGNWQSWAALEYNVPGRETPMPAHDLLSRTVFYKVGHHCSHNATLKKGGLELMNRDDLVAFIPLDKATASKQGKKGWDMPAGPLYKALCEKAANRVVISDVAENVPAEATQAGVIATETYVDYFLK